MSSSVGPFTSGGNAVSVNGAVVPLSQPLLGSNSAGQLIAGSSSAGAMTQIAAVVTAGGQTSVAFSSLGAFTSLQIDFVTRSSAAVNNEGLVLHFNGDTAANYGFSSVSSTDGTNNFNAQANPLIAVVPGSSVDPNFSAGGRIWVPFYRQTVFYKTAHAQTELANGSSNHSSLFHGGLTWASLAAITSVTLTLPSGLAYVTGSQFVLYGIQ